MAVETVSREGDFIIPSSHHGVLLRVHFAEDAMFVSVRDGVAICFTIEEAEELRDWITRRLDEPHS